MTLKEKEFHRSPHYSKERMLLHYYSDDKTAYEFINEVTSLVYKKLDNPIVENIKLSTEIFDFLITGYLVYHLKNDGKYYRRKNISNVVLTIGNYNKLVWQCWEWKDITGEYNFNDILYISYFDINETSILSKYMFNRIDDIHYEVDNIVKDLSEYKIDYNKIISIDKDIKRTMTLKKLMSNVK